MESHREQHHRQLAELRKEITDKQSRIDELTEYVPLSVCLSVCLVGKCLAVYLGTYKCMSSVLEGVFFSLTVPHQHTVGCAVVVTSM